MLIGLSNLSSLFGEIVHDFEDFRVTCYSQPDYCRPFGDCDLFCESMTPRVGLQKVLVSFNMLFLLKKMAVLKGLSGDYLFIVVSSFGKSKIEKCQGTMVPSLSA